ncbi:protein ORF67 [Cyprinid herpesvirus 1]|uniref:Protein ORF67 n=1 Tax=Cyprinid herpesvirus 1 TaxID=317858 RepID=K7PBD0_9VIRU|nr:protein ORF67 [Cyprinid herpesvirus 1]AFJ20364.1 protein ORF67 [Cyprinid herpesvirus 1]
MNHLRRDACPVVDWCSGSHRERNPRRPCDPLEAARPVLQICDQEGLIHSFTGPAREAGRYHSQWPVWQGCLKDPFELTAFPVMPLVNVKVGTSGPLAVMGRCSVTPAMDPFYAEFLWDYGEPEQESEHCGEPLGPGCFKLLFCYNSRYIAYLCRSPLTSEAFDRIPVHSTLTVERPDDGVPDECYERRAEPWRVRP